MKEFKKLMSYCNELNRKGHAVYGDPDVPEHTLVDSSPHASYIGPDYYSRARQVAASITKAKRLGRVQEHFTPAPALYDDAYSFFGVHRQFEDLHEVYVPDVPCAIGAGATFEEAMDEVVVKLSCQLLQMREEGLEVPKASSAQEVEERGRKGHVEAASGYGPPVALRVVTVHSDFLKVPTPSDAELEQLTRVASDIWRSIQGSKCCAPS
jgi:predicted RNase H-like HicB family nuclease